jgi:Fic-DOC domain mobile mystery protein B
MNVPAQPNGATPLDHEDRLGLIPNGIKTRQLLNQLEAKNIVRAQIWVANQKWDTSKLLTSAMMRRTHREMFGEVWSWAGKFRSRETTIEIAPEQIGVGTEQLMGNIEFQLVGAQSTQSKRHIIANLHHQLVKIHLFPNGNGRHARLICDVFSQCLEIETPQWNGQNLIDQEESRKLYLQSLRHADKTGTLGPLIEFMWK